MNRLPGASRLRWWRELVVILGFYMIYSWIRNQFGSSAVEPATALANAERIIDIQRALGLYFEPTLQDWFIDAEWFIVFWNVFYGTFHFIVTPAALVFLYRRHPAAYPRYRSIGLITTGLALIGFAAFPLMPPRLLGGCGIYGGCVDSPFVDTMAEIGGFWSFDSDAVETISNQYAAMPSLHFAWSFWCFMVLYPRLKRRTGKVLIAVYPWVTVFCIVVTANHFWLDAAGGALALAGGTILGSALTSQLHARGRDLGVEPDRVELSDIEPAAVALASGTETTVDDPDAQGDHSPGPASPGPAPPDHPS